MLVFIMCNLGKNNDYCHPADGIFDYNYNSIILLICAIYPSFFVEGAK